MKELAQHVGIWLHIGVWLVGLLTAWLAFLANGLYTIFRRPLGARWPLIALALAIATSVAMVDAGEWLQKVGSVRVANIYQLGQPLILVGLLGGTFCATRLIGTDNTSRQFRLIYGLLAWSGMLSCWISYRYFNFTRGEMEITVEEFSTSLVAVEDTFLRTDVGRLLRVYESPLAEQTGNCDDSPAILTSGYVIRREKPTPRYNCHGWVFTGGRYVVKSEDVETILHDNGYSEVEQPQVGDLVVYRDEQGRIIHTGVVRGILDDGTPLLESKWGFAGRFLHRPEEQVYSTNYRFYRTSRPARGSGVVTRHWLDVVRTRSTQRVAIR
ncbi:MAG: hypothetical protein KatS3mg109_1409 [Pirellulaceae bacterium]|nr:MAG: hypothetical protein KatS3mg109_1409 [Pirellulaceae bacterium]